MLSAACANGLQSIPSPKERALGSGDQARPILRHRSGLHLRKVEEGVTSFSFINKCSVQDFILSLIETWFVD